MSRYRTPEFRDVCQQRRNKRFLYAVVDVALGTIFAASIASAFMQYVFY